MLRVGIVELLEVVVRGQKADKRSRKAVSGKMRKLLIEYIFA
jgi:hypothetical protein